MNTKKYFITLFSFIIFSIYFTLSGVFVPFIASIPQSNGGFKTLSSQNDFYKMVDNFYDPDEFYNFRTDNQNINILANFYNTLNASSRITFIYTKKSYTFHHWFFDYFYFTKYTMFVFI